MFEQIKKILPEVNRPSRYIGHEVGSLNKEFDSAIVKTAIAFPDLYEIGVSNLGHRILYHLINAESSGSFMADRVYAPEVDFKTKLLEYNLPLYGVESFRALSEFDIVAFSLQYELSYPTILSILEMGGINIKSAQRAENAPLVIAGGPGSYNPEPLSDFIDVFIIGDGEDILIELLNSVKESKLANKSREESLKAMQKIEGIYVPRFYKVKEPFSSPYPISSEFPEKINKRISKLSDSACAVDFPVPYMACVHDRAVLEIRRGCGRMCRFCQPCFVNLPIRERPAENIVKLTGELLDNTGYDEYSLLSLSSSDYGNIEELISALNQEHSAKGISISLPSQRADAFSVELANLVQSVRKSTLTFAPEAGSQRLRNAINKNLSEEQILNAVLSAYEAGWNKIKLYFMIGLPTESFEDLDEIISLLQKIKNMANGLKGEHNLKKHLDLTCTMSIFVPKPFTPFQWCDQDSVEIIGEKIKYLQNAVRNLRGVKLNFHDIFLSQLEAVFSRGDRSLNELIEIVYKKGSYLDAWNEHFNRQIWMEAAEELGIKFENFSSKKICLESETPWDIINIGIDKDWLIEEYKKAQDSLTSIPCDEACADCGVCNTFKQEPDRKSQESLTTKKSEHSSKEIFPVKYRLKLKKTGYLKYISHLDWQRMLYKAVKKAKIDLCFTQGFNPSPKISIGLALPIFVESFSEYADIEIKEEMKEEDLKEKINGFLPEESKIASIVKISKEDKAIDTIVNWAKYSASPLDFEVIKKIDFNQVVRDILSKENIILERKKSRGLKKLIDVRSFIHSIKICEDHLEFILMTGQNGNLRPDEFVNILTPGVKWDITRKELLDKDLKVL